MGLSSLLKRGDKGAIGGTPASAEFIDHSEASEPTARDYADAATHARHGPGDGPATFILADSPTGAPIGTASVNAEHPDAVRASDGQVVRALGNGEQVTAIVTSGAKGLGKNGTAAVGSLRSTGATGVDQRDAAVVGEAAGTNPELVVRAVEGAPSAPSWLDKLVGNANQQEDDSQMAKVAGLAIVAPPTAVGVDLSGIGPANGSSDASSTLEVDKERHRVHSQPVTDSSGKAIPTQLARQTDTSTMGTGGASSLADQILEELSPSPATSNERFHRLFPMLPAEDRLIEDYRCAFSREILIQGRLYVSESHLAFRANILGIETSFVVPFTEIVLIEKRLTASIFNNAIEVSTANQAHLFTSFIKRDSAYELITRVWRHWHGEEHRLRDEMDGQSLAEDTPTLGADDDAKSIVSYSDDEGHRKSFKLSKLLPDALKLRALRSHQQSVRDDLTASQRVKEDHHEAEAEAVAEELSGADKHAETSYDGPEFDNVALDTVLPTSPELAYELIFRDDKFLESFWSDNEGLKDISIGAWKKGAQGETRELSYIRPLNGSIGPKQTKCEIVDELEHVDPQGYISDVTTTHTPDVPSGSSFAVKTRTVFTWSKAGGTRMRVTTVVEWSKVNRFLKSIIESSCLTGQKQYHTDLEAAVRSHIKANPERFALAGVVEEEVEKGGIDKVEGSAQSVDAGGTLSMIRDSLSNPVILLSLLVLLLAVSNVWMLLAQPRGGRVGQPEEVASAIERVLAQWDSAYAQSAPVDRSVELEGIVVSLSGIEGQIRRLRDRVEAIRV